MQDLPQHAYAGAGSSYVHAPQSVYMSSFPWRHSVRALALTPDGSVFLGKHRTPMDSCGQHLAEASSAANQAWMLYGANWEEPVHVWHQEILDSTIAPGFQGVKNDYYLVHVDRFEHRGELMPEALQGEGLEGFACWCEKAIRAHSDQLFSPRDLATLLPTITHDSPRNPCYSRSKSHSCWARLNEGLTRKLILLLDAPVIDNGLWPL